MIVFRTGQSTLAVTWGPDPRAVGDRGAVQAVEYVGQGGERDKRVTPFPVPSRLRGSPGVHHDPCLLGGEEDRLVGWIVPAGTAFQQGDVGGDLPECVTRPALILSVRLGCQAERCEPHGGRAAGSRSY